MKKILLTVCCYYSLNTHAQVLNKGDRLFGGSFSFSVFNYNSNNFPSNQGGNAGIAPSFSWLIENNTALGMRGGVSYSRTKTDPGSGYTNISRFFNTGAGVFLKKYKALKEKFGIYFDHELGINFLSNKQTTGIPASTVKNKMHGISYRFSPGVFYKFSAHFFGEANIGGAYAAYNKGTGANSFNAGLSFFEYFNLGINFRIGKRA